MSNIWISRAVFFVLYVIFYAVMLVGKRLDPRFGIVPKSLPISPSLTVRIQSSKNSRRRIKVDVYEPRREGKEEERKALPVHVSFHASGFVVPVYGCDAELNVHWTRTLGCIVLDVDYAKAPFHPAPAALEDALDVLEYITSRPDVYDASRVTLGGFSSGANIAILASVWSNASASADVNARNAGSRVRGVIACYPPTNLTRTPSAQPGTMAGVVSSAVHRCLRESYMPPGTDASDPRISPLFAPSELFPPLTLIVGSEDKLVVDSMQLHKKLEEDGIDCVLSVVPGAGHAWEWFVKPDTPLWEERAKALKLMESRMRKAMGL